MQALFVVGAWVPRMGFVPLGFDAVADACIQTGHWTCPLSPEQDGVISCAALERWIPRCDGLQAGQIRVSYAYPHDGLETFPLLAMVLASDPNDDDKSTRPTSVLFSHATRWSDVTPNALAADQFLEIPNGHWMPSQRAYTLTGLSSRADFIQLRADDGVRSWRIYAPLPPMPAVFELPPIPAGAPGFDPVDVSLTA